MRTPDSHYFVAAVVAAGLQTAPSQGAEMRAVDHKPPQPPQKIVDKLGDVLGIPVPTPTPPTQAPTPNSMPLKEQHEQDAKEQKPAHAFPKVEPKVGYGVVGHLMGNNRQPAVTPRFKQPRPHNFHKGSHLSRSRGGDRIGRRSRI